MLSKVYITESKFVCICCLLVHVQCKHWLPKGLGEENDCEDDKFEEEDIEDEEVDMLETEGMEDAKEVSFAAAFGADMLETEDMEDAKEVSFAVAFGAADKEEERIGAMEEDKFVWGNISVSNTFITMSKF